MTVFIVLRFNDDNEPRVRAVFSTRELAESFAQGGDSRIVEIEVDSTDEPDA